MPLSEYLSDCRCFVFRYDPIKFLFLYAIVRFCVFEDACDESGLFAYVCESGPLSFLCMCMRRIALVA